MSRAARTRAGLLRHVHPPRRPIAHALSGESCARARGAHARATGWLTSPTRVARAADRGVLSSLRAVPKRGDPMRRIILKPEVTRERSRRGGAPLRRMAPTRSSLSFLTLWRCARRRWAVLVQLRELTPLVGSQNGSDPCERQYLVHLLCSPPATREVRRHRLRVAEQCSRGC